MAERTTDEVTKKLDVARRKAAPATTEPAAPSIFDLQRSAGNAAVVSMLTEAPVQTKGLQVGAVHDPAEAEADRIADQVLRTPETAKTPRRKERIRRFMSADGVFQATVEEEAKEGEA